MSPCTAWALRKRASAVFATSVRGALGSTATTPARGKARATAAAIVPGPQPTSRIRARPATCGARYVSTHASASTFAASRPASRGASLRYDSDICGHLRCGGSNADAGELARRLGPLVEAVDVRVHRLERGAKPDALRAA